MDFAQGIIVGFGSACLLFGYAYWAHFMRPTWIKPRGIASIATTKFRRGPLTRTDIDRAAAQVRDLR